MSDSAARYYETLAADYAVTIRQLVPRYDEMLEAIATAITLHLDRPTNAAPAADTGAGPRRVLEVGAGTGEVSGLLLHRLERVEITAVEPSATMLDILRLRLEPWREQVQLQRTDALHFPTHPTYHAAASHLVLHNLNNRDKRKALRRVHNALVRNGVFVWGDMMRRPDARQQAAVIAERTLLARAAGCAEDLIAENFRKEAHDDTPWTVHETLTALRRIGFRNADCIWSGGAFAIFTTVR